MLDPDDDDLPDEPSSKTITSVEPPKKKAPAPAPVEPKAEPEPEPKKHTHTQRLVSIATQMGFSQADLDSHPSAVIWDEIDRLNRAAAARQAPPKVAEPEQKVKVEEEADDVEAFLKTCEDEPTAKMIRALAKRADSAKKVEALEAELKKIRERDEAREQNSAVDLVDEAFESLGADYAAIFGTGSIRDMKQGQDEAERRGVVFVRAGIDTTKMTARQIKAAIVTVAKKLFPVVAAKVPTVEKPLADAATYPETNLPKKLPAKDPVNGRFTAEDFEGAKVQRPSAKQTGLDKLSPEEGLRQVLRKHGDPRADRPVVEIDEDLPE